MKFKFCLISFLIIFSYLLANNLFAAGVCLCDGKIQSEDENECKQFITNNPGCKWDVEAPPSGAGGTTPAPQPVKLDNPLGKGDTGSSPQKLLGNIINVVLGITGSIALVMFILGGFTWMTSAGNSERVSRGKNILIWATIGLVIIFSAYALVKFVFTSIGAT